MSSRDLERVEVMGWVASGALKLAHAAEMLELSYRQTKRLWRRYRKKGAEGLKHGHAGQASNRGKPRKLRRPVLQLIQKKYSGTEAERFGPTLAAEHLVEEDGIVIDHETLRRWMLAEIYGVGSESTRNTISGESAKRTLASWCSWTAAFMIGWKGGDREAA